MCGISGIYYSKEINNINIRINRMLESMHHRGPDASNYIIDNNVALAHNRLKIIDLSDAANMPMQSTTKRYTLVFNGEIYNYKELKENIDYKFITESDSEVIIAYAEHNRIDEFINAANGMFAIALYDNKNNELTLFRDRLGIKPLYYYKDDNFFIFGSEIKAILNSGLIDAKENETSYDSYLAYRYVPEPNTFFKNIYHLEAGSKMQVSINGDCVTSFSTKYWQLPKSNSSTKDISSD
ncbi:MAG: asparagine synthetase B, partial [Bacteroidetes bacterium]